MCRISQLVVLLLLCPVVMGLECYTYECNARRVNCTEGHGPTNRCDEVLRSLDGCGETSGGDCTYYCTKYKKAERDTVFLSYSCDYLAKGTPDGCTSPTGRGTRCVCGQNKCNGAQVHTTIFHPILSVCLLSTIMYNPPI